MPSLSKQIETKEVVPITSKEKGKEKGKAPSKAKRKTREPPTQGTLKRKLLASAIQAAKRVEVWFPSFLH